MNTIPRTVTGGPLAESNETALKKSSPEDEEAPGEEKKDDTGDAPSYAASRVTNVEVSVPEDDDAKLLIEQGDIVVTAYGKGKVLAAMKETQSMEVELPYGRLFVRLSEVVTKETGGASQPKVLLPSECHSGIWLFTDRENITHFFKPNFFPPYNTPEKKKIILDVLREEWDEKTLSWKPCGKGSMTKAKGSSLLGGDNNSALCQLDELMGNVLSTINGCCTPQAAGSSK